MNPSALRKAGLVLAGVVMGLLGLAIGLWFYLQAARVEEVRSSIGEEIQVAREAIEDIEVVQDSAVRVVLRDVLLHDERGDTVAAAPRVTLTLDARSLAGDGAIEIFDVRLEEPYARLLRAPDGSWNFEQPLGMAAAGKPVEGTGGRPLHFRDISLEDGRFLVSLPDDAAPADDARFALALPRVRLGGVPYQVYALHDVDARLSSLTLGDRSGWRVALSSFSGQLEEPNLRIDQLAGVMAQEGEDGVRFALESLEWGESSLRGEGLVRFADEGNLYDLDLRTEALSFADLKPLIPTLPEEGGASFALSVESVNSQRVAIGFTGLDASLGRSRALGAISVALGGDLPPSLLDASIQFAPLDLAVLAQFGLVESLPVAGLVEGRIDTAEAPPGRAMVDLAATLVPADDASAPPSSLFATGTVGLVSPAEPFRLDGITLSAQPLHLALLRTIIADESESLRGDVTGSVSLAGTLREVELAGGDLAYRLEDAPSSRLTDLSGTIDLAPELRYDIEANAEPLALATLTALFPALPFRAATLEGPIRLSGDTSGLDLRADLSGTSGGIRMDGTLTFGEPFQFDLGGSVRAFAAGMVLRPELPLESPLTGTFALMGTADRFDFDVDLTQSEGNFDLTGTVVLSVDPFEFELAGDVSRFRLGAVIGLPALFPDPMSGSIALNGGGGRPYQFDFDLAGAQGLLDLAGSYLPGDIPRYEVAGRIAGLDIRGLPVQPDLPPTDLTGDIDIQGQGLDAETLAGTFNVDLGASSVSGLPLETALARVDVEAGVMRVDTLAIQFDDSSLSAAGNWGLTAPAAEPLRYAFSSPDLSTFGRIIEPSTLLPPRLAGSLVARGTVGGSFDYPTITSEVSGSGLQYEQWEASSVEGTLAVRRDEAVGWNGDLALVGEDIIVPTVDTFEDVRLEATGDEENVAVGLFARRDASSDVSASGILELRGLVPEGIGLQTMALRVDDMNWALQSPARLHYTSDDGLLVENLTLRRTGDVEGTVAVNGTIPPDGVANFTIQATNLDLADLRRVTPLAPEVAGSLDLDALLTGPVDDPELAIDAIASNLTIQGVNTDSVTLNARYAGQLLTGTADAEIGGQRLFTVDGNVPMTLVLDRMVPSVELLSAEPLSVTAVADSLPMNLLAALVPNVAEGEGAIQAQVDLSGTMDSPVLQGWARLDRGALTIEPLAARYTGIRADLVLDGERVTINELSATSGGTIQATGTIDFPSSSTPLLAIDATLRDFRLMDDPDAATVTASGALSLDGDVSAPVLTGNVVLSESTFQVPQLSVQPAGLELGYTEVASTASIPEFGESVVPPVLGNLQVDGVEVSLDESVWLESPDLRIQITGDVVLYRTGEELRVFGALEAVRGTYALEISAIVREFDVLGGRVQFFGTGDLNPSLDIQAGYRVRNTSAGTGGDITILVQLTGTLRAPRIALTADTPVPLSEADLISYLLFGQPSFELAGLTRSFAEQVLVQEVVGGYIATELLERPLLRAGVCDWVRVRPGATTSLSGLIGRGALEGAVIECGWELAADLFLTGQTGIGGLFGGEFIDWRLGVEWQIDDQWMWNASYGTVARDPTFDIFNMDLQRQFSTELRRQWEYGKPRQERPIDFIDDEPLPSVAGPPLPAVPALDDPEPPEP